MRLSSFFYTCWRIQLNNKKLLCITDAKKIIEVCGENYTPHANFTKSAAQHHIDNTQTSIQLNGVLSSSLLNNHDIDAGLYSNARVKVFLVDACDNKVIKTIFYGFVGAITTCQNKYQIELKDFSSKLHNQFGDIYSPQCRVPFGSEKCGVDLNKLKFNSKIIRVINNTAVELEGKFSDNQFSHGVLRVLSGNNKNCKCTIISNTQKLFEIEYPFLKKCEKGDIVEISQGCSKNINDCIKRYDNAINFRGEPFIPNITKF